MKWRLASTILVTIAAAALLAQTVLRLQESFHTPGTRLNLAVWTTEIGMPSYLGRTQLADWISPGGVGQFVVDAGGGRLTLNTFNPTGLSLYGTHARTLATFLPTATSTIELTTRLQLTTIRRGLVYSSYLYRCATPCLNHDEIDIELVTNMLQPGAPMRVQLNRYANEPLGAGNGILVDLPAAFDPLAAHDWTIRWSLSRIDYVLDGVLLHSTDTHVPQGPMHANVIAWAPDSDWPAAYDATLQPATSAESNVPFSTNVRSVVVRELHGAVPEAPTNVVALVNGSVLNVSWTALPSAVPPTGHVLTFHSGGPATLTPKTIVARVTAGAANEASLTIPPGTQGAFTVRVEAVSGDAISLPSSPATFAVGAAPPSAPMSLLGLVNGNSVALAWRNSFDGGSPTAAVLDVSGALVTSIPLGLTDAFQFDAVPSGTYNLSVRATNAVGSSASSNAITLAFPGPCSGAPFAPSGFVANRTGRTITVSWNPAITGPAPTEYVLAVTGSYVGSFAVPGRTLSGAVGSGTYGLSVAATNVCGASAATPTQTVVVP